MHGDVSVFFFELDHEKVWDHCLAGSLVSDSGISVSLSSDHDHALTVDLYSFERISTEMMTSHGLACPCLTVENESVLNKLSETKVSLLDERRELKDFFLNFFLVL